MQMWLGAQVGSSNVTHARMVVESLREGACTSSWVRRCRVRRRHSAGHFGRARAAAWGLEGGEATVERAQCSESPNRVRGNSVSRSEQETMASHERPDRQNGPECVL